MDTIIHDNNEVNIVFLDTNGVLNFSKHRESELRHGRTVQFEYMALSKEALKLVGKLCKETDAKVVVTSTWRKYEGIPGGSFNNLLRQLREVAGVEIIGTTPVIDRDKERDKEIGLWLEDNSELKIRNFVIIDDDDVPDYEEQLVRCNRDIGFTTPDLYEQAYNILTA